MTARFRARYGASPLHLLAHLAALALAAFALIQIAERPAAVRIALWLGATVVLHDLVLLPFYSVLDRAGRRAAGRGVNYVRVPALVAALLGLVYFPVISGQGAPVFRNVSGVRYEGYLARWLLVSAALFAISGALYLLRGRSST